MSRFARLWLDAVDLMLAFGHPHWDWLYRLSSYWGNPLCAGFCLGWARIETAVYRRTGYEVGSQFAHSPRVPRKAWRWKSGR